MKVFFLAAALLSAFASSANARIVVVPSPEACQQAEKSGADTVLRDACRSLKAGQPVDLACPLSGCPVTTK
jgi:hypothetical protein